MIQIDPQTGARMTPSEIFSNLSNSRTVAIMSPAFDKIPGVEQVMNAEGLEKYIKSPQNSKHTVFFIEDKNVPGMLPALDRLRKAGFSIFVYNEKDLGIGVEKVFYVGQFA